MRVLGALQIASLDREFLVEHVDVLLEVGRDRLELGDLLDRLVDRALGLGGRLFRLRAGSAAPGSGAGLPPAPRPRRLRRLAGAGEPGPAAAADRRPREPSQATNATASCDSRAMPRANGDGPIIKHGWDVGQFLKGLGRNARS